MRRSGPESTEKPGAFIAASETSPPTKCSSDFGRRHHRQHRPARQRRDELPAACNQPQRILERHHAGQRGSDVLADAVSDHRRRPDAPRSPQLRQRVADDEQRRLGPSRVTQLLGRPRPSPLRREQQLPQIGAKVRLENARAAIDGAANDRLRSIESLGHARVLRSLTREHEHDRTLGCGDARGHALRLPTGAHERVMVIARHHQRPSMTERSSSDVQRVGDIGQVQFRMRRAGATPAGW